MPTPVRRARAYPEDALQRSVAQYLSVALPDRLGVVWYAVPNGGRRNRIEAARFKGMGVRAGVPDLAFITKDGPPFFIELKSESGRLSEAQKAMIERLRMAGATTYLCRSIADVERVLKAEGIEPAGTVA